MIARNAAQMLMILAVVAQSGRLSHADDQAAAPDANPPASQPATKPSAIAPEARELVDQMAEAYSKLKSLDLSGTLSKDFDVNGDAQKLNTTFTAAYGAPNKFRHTLKDGNEELTWGSTGAKAYAFQKSANVYITSDVDAGRVATEELPEPLAQLMPSQNPSIQFAVAKDPAAEIIRDAAAVTKADDTTLDGKPYQTLKVDLNDKRKTTLLVDPQTHLLREVRTDVKDMLEDKGTPGVKHAWIIVDYTTVSADGPLHDEQFAWKAPEGAHEQNSAGPTSPLVGKTAPDFKLDLLAGGQVSLSELKGSVVVLDFWATWCPPCRKSLPHLNKLYEDNKAGGAKVFAVNCQEEKGEVQNFVTKTKLTVPVLLATTDETIQAYEAHSIPTTVIIGKDGKVSKIFTGYGPDSAKQMDKAVAEALAK